MNRAAQVAALLDGLAGEDPGAVASILREFDTRDIAAALVATASAAPGGSQPGTLMSQEVLFVNSGDEGTYTGEIELPAGARLWAVILTVEENFDGDSPSITVDDESESILSDALSAMPDAYHVMYDMAAWSNGIVAQGAGKPYPSGQTITAVLGVLTNAGATGRAVITVAYWTALTPIDPTFVAAP